VVRISREHALLLILLAIALALQCGYAFATLDVIRHGEQRPAWPFWLNEASRRIAAGPYQNSEIEAIDGHRFTAGSQFRAALGAAQPGQSITLTLRQPNGAVSDVAVQLGHERTAGWDFASAALAIALDVVVPLVCLGLGFGVAAIRPRDRLAWILLGLLLCFSEQVTNFRWMWPLRDAAQAWHSTLGGLWPLWMLLFGIYFPSASRLEQKSPWIKWLLIVPILLVQFFFTGAELIWSRDIAAAEALRPLLNALHTPYMVLGMIAVGSFFANLGEKTGTATSSDARRRLGILYTGASISLTPLFLIVLYAVFRRRPLFEGVAGPLQIVALLLLALFPLTLAYVIVVHRALDVRVVLRQSLKYALVRGGLWVVRTTVVVCVVVLITRTFADPRSRRVDRVRAIGSAIALFFLQRRFAIRVDRAIDRRFFREAYDAEQVLSELSNKVRGFTETRPLLETVTERISVTLHVPRAAVLVKEGDKYCLAEARGLDQGAARCLPAASRTIDYLKETNRPSAVYFDDPPAWMAEASDEERKRLEALSAQVLLPLAGREELAGVMVLGPKRSEEPYSPADLRLLQLVAAQTGMALENSQLIAALAAEAAQRERQLREIEIAREVQERLFPQQFPPVAGLDYAGRCRPAQGVGGDYYDFLQLSNGSLGVAIGDVSGKGISAALLMASLQASLRGQTLAELRDLSALMRNVNRLVYDASASNRYATFFYGEYDPSKRRLAYVNAGHNPPMILRDAETLRLPATGAVVGLLKGVDFEQAECELKPGDLFIGYTDGVSEALTPAEEEWGEDRLIAAAQEVLEKSAPDIITYIIEAADRFTTGAKQYDDMTLVVLKIQ
jgi:sigma-B regulation protein RsbU (phosphoserine phosphatase)